jgi:hypothetical protein
MSAPVTSASTSWRSMAWCAVPLFLALIVPAIFWDHGCFEEETTTFVRQYTAADGRSLLQKVFDPHANDIDTYQARELSYLIDLADAHAYPYLARWIEPGFSLPVSSFLVSIGLVLIVAAGLRHRTGPGERLNAALLLACFVTSFCFVSTMGLFYRSAKPVLALAVVGWVFLLLRIVRQGRRDPDATARRVTPGVAGLFLLTLAAGLLDRQGAYLTLVAAALLIVHVRRTGEQRGAAVATVAGAVAVQAYGMLVGPWVVYALNGYWPDFSYQRVPASELLRLPNHLLRSLSLLAQNTLLMFGGNWIVSGGAALIAAVAMWRHEAARKAPGVRAWLSRLRSSGPAWRLRHYAGWILLSQLLMFALMIARHGPVYRWIDHRFWYYPLPFLALLLCGGLLALRAWAPALPGRQRRLLPAVLTVLVLSNLLSLDHRRDIMVSGPWFGQVYPQCQLLKTSLRVGEPHPQLNGPFRLLFDHSRAAQTAAAR